MGHDVFISYSSKDASVADLVCRGIESAGTRCWIASRDIVASAEYAEQIVGALQTSRVFLLIFSSSSNASKEVLREIGVAEKLDLPIVLLRIEQTLPARGLAYYLNNLNWLDAANPPRQQHIDRLVGDIGRLIGRPGDAAPSPASRPPAPQHTQPTAHAAAPGGTRVRWTGAAVIATGVLAVGALLSSPGSRGRINGATDTVTPTAPVPGVTETTVARADSLLPAPITGRLYTVTMAGDARSYRFEPSHLSLKVGDGIEFRPVSGFPHNISLGESARTDQEARFDANMSGEKMGTASSRMLSHPGESVKLSFGGVRPGTYQIICQVHLAMGMVLRVTVE